jgi:hypothetical protein
LLNRKKLVAKAEEETRFVKSKTMGSIIELGLETLPTSMDPKNNRKKNNRTSGVRKKGKGGQTKKRRTFRQPI